MVGPVGMDGLPAPNPVELVLKHVHEAAPIHVHEMVGNLAQEKRALSDRATGNLALVRNECRSGADLRGRVQGVRTPLSALDDLRLANTTGILQKKVSYAIPWWCTPS